MSAMPSAGAAPAPLIVLGREAVEAVAATGDISNFGGVALRNEARDAIFKPLPSYEAATDAISAVPMVAERYGSRDVAGDRLTLQFIYQLFPRASTRGVGEDMRRLWRRFIAELQVPIWVYRGAANLRNFEVDRSVPDPLRLEDGVTIRSRSFEALGSLGFNKFTLDALADDWSEGWGSSSYVICVDQTLAKSPENVVRGDSTGIMAAQQAIACLHLVACGDVMMGPMWFTRSSRFDVGLGSGRLRGGSPVPTLGRSQYVLTRAIAREVRSLQRKVRYLGVHGYESGPGNLDVALQFFLSSYDRFPSRPESQLVDAITAAEAVLGSGIANTFKLAFRVAGMLGRTNAERVQVFDDMRRFYAIRNSIVHGDRLTETQGQRLGRVDDARDYVRRLLVAFVRFAASSSPTRYTKQFFKDDLDAELQDEQARRRMLRELGIIR
jgi:Apea-like HEPN